MAHGEFNINGLQNKSVRRLLPELSPASISRILKRLRVHGIIKKVSAFEKREWYRKLGFRPAIEKEYEEENNESLVYMYLDLYDPQLIEDYFENP